MIRVGLRSPVQVLRTVTPCLDCRLDPDAGEHTTTPAECLGKTGQGCHDPAAHHAYRPLPWWRRLRVERGGWW